jgi:hypothetical protein
MNLHTRNGFKWSVNEILSLQREFELLGWGIDEIAQKHKRTPNAIMYKLDQEGFADYNVLYSNYYYLNAPIPVDNKSHDLCLEHNDSEDYESQVDDNDEEYVDNADCEDSGDEDDEDDYVADLSERVYGLEESVSEIRDMIKQMMSTFSKSSSSKSWF